MEENIRIIKSASIPEREEIITDFARWLETTSQDALVYGEGRFAVMSAKYGTSDPHKRRRTCTRQSRND